MSKMMCAAFALVAALTAFGPEPAAAATEYPWCAQYGWRGGRNCGFSTFRQCQATVSGIGGFCERNQFYEGRARRR